MLTKETLEILKSLTALNNQMIIGNTQLGQDEFESIIFRCDLSKIDDIPEEFGIFDTSNFLMAMDLLEDPEVVLKDKVLTAKDENGTLEFLTSDISSLEDIHVDERKITTTVQIPSVLEFEFDTDLIQKIKKASSVFKAFDSLWISNNGFAGKTELKLGTKNSFGKSSNTFKINVDADLETGHEFQIALPIESILKIPSMDYKFSVKYNKERDTYRVVLDNALLTFVMSLQRD